MNIGLQSGMGNAPVIAALTGDPAGIGPEVCVKALKALASGQSKDLCHPVLIGDVEIVRRAAAFSKVDMPVVRVEAGDIRDLRASLRPEAINVLDPGGFDADSMRHGVASIASGELVFDGLELADRLGRNSVIQGVVLGPVHSESMKATGRISDMDELQPAGTFMLRLTGKLRVVPLSEHVPLAQAISSVTPGRVLALIRLLDSTMKSWGFAKPRIAVAGINPHALFEDDRVRISPAIDAARDEGILASGPIAPDSVFRMALDGGFDAIVTMFHDQGQIVVKTVGFSGACTVYIGLPHVLVNVPHGTAFDIAGKGIAQHFSMLAAMETAAHLAAGKGPAVQA